MSFDWRQFVELAGRLLTGTSLAGLPQASWRTSISRSHCGAFCAATDRLRRRIGYIRETNRHEFVREQYIYSANETERKIGRLLQSLSHKSTKADSEARWIVPVGEVKQAFRIANQILRELSSL